MKKIFKYILIGFISIIPAVITAQILLFIYSSFYSGIVWIYGYTNDWIYTISAIILSIMFLYITGHSVIVYGTSIYIKTIEKVVNKLPVINSIYSIIRKVLDMFFSEDKKFSEVVYIEYPRRGIWVPAYVTNKIENSYILFVPTSPNPTSGFTVIVNEKEVIRSKMKMDEATSFIVSIGVDLEKEEIIKEMEELPIDNN